MVKEDAFITILPFMVNDLKLKGNELLTFAIIHGFTMYGDGGWFTGSSSYIAEWCGCSKPTVFRCLKSLEEKGFIRRRETITNGVKLVDYQAKNFTRAIKKLYRGDKETLSGGDKETLYQNIEYETIEETIDIKPDKKKPRNRYGEYQNVLLTDEDLEKLKSEFPHDWQQRIENLSSYMSSTGKKYRNHLATIRNWARRNGEKREGYDPNRQGRYATEVVNANARKRMEELNRRSLERNGR